MSNIEQWIRVLNEQIADCTNAINVAGLTSADEEALTLLADTRDKLIALLQIRHRINLTKSYAVSLKGVAADTRSFC
jgi:hypothetical protein